MGWRYERDEDAAGWRCGGMEIREGWRCGQQLLLGPEAHLYQPVVGDGQTPCKLRVFAFGSRVGNSLVLMVPEGAGKKSALHPGG